MWHGIKAPMLSLPGAPIAWASLFHTHRFPRYPCVTSLRLSLALNSLDSLFARIDRTKQIPKRIDPAAAVKRDIRPPLRGGLSKATRGSLGRKPAPRMEAGPCYAPPGPPPPRYRPLTTALREIRPFPCTDTALIPELPFERIVQAVIEDFVEESCVSPDATRALKEAADAYIAELLEESGACAVHGKRVTITVKDMQLARRIPGERM